MFWRTAMDWPMTSKPAHAGDAAELARQVSSSASHDPRLADARCCVSRYRRFRASFDWKLTLWTASWTEVFRQVLRTRSLATLLHSDDGCVEPRPHSRVHRARPRDLQEGNGRIRAKSAVGADILTNSHRMNCGLM